MKLKPIDLIKPVLVLYVIFHACAHVLYLAPINPATSQYSSWVSNYMDSFFSQNWHLFAPEPATSSLDLLYRCDSTHSWQAPLQELFREHKAFPVTAKGKQTYIFQNLAREIFNAKLLRLDESKIQELKIAQRFLKDRCGTFSDAELQIKRTYTQDYSKRMSQEPNPVEAYNLKIERGNVAWK